MRLLRRLWSWIWGPPAPVQDTARTVDEEWADIWMRRLFPQRWARTQGTIEQRLQAMLIACKEEGQPCWSKADWMQIHLCIKGVQGRWADIWMRRLFPQRWEHTQGTIEQRLQAIWIARNEDGQPCWSEEDEEDWKMMYEYLKGVRGPGRVRQ